MFLFDSPRISLPLAAREAIESEFQKKKRNES